MGVGKIYLKMRDNVWIRKLRYLNGRKERVVQIPREVQDRLGEYVVITIDEENIVTVYPFEKAFEKGILIKK